MKGKTLKPDVFHTEHFDFFYIAHNTHADSGNSIFICSFIRLQKNFRQSVYVIYAAYEYAAHT